MAESYWKLLGAWSQPRQRQNSFANLTHSRIIRARHGIGSRKNDVTARSKLILSLYLWLIVTL